MKYQVINMINILRPADGSDCTNGGLSSIHEKATLLVPEGMEGLHEPISLLGGVVEIDWSMLKDAPFILKRRVILGSPYYHAEPFHPGKIEGYMFGGNFLSYSGNGFRTITQYPIPIHDRVE